MDEWERNPGGRRRCRTVFLAGAECPFTCVFCDLWRFTTETPTPRGAVPRQIEQALADGALGIEALKLYNASNFFDPRAVPAADLPAIARLTAGFDRVIVECHPRLVDERAVDFSARLEGALEVALGLETVHPGALAGLNKRMTVEDYDRACAFALARGLALRTFVLVGAPFVPQGARLEWVGRSVEHALQQGVDHVALIPMRSGNGALERLEAQGLYAPPTLAEIEVSFAAALQRQPRDAVVTLDLWDSGRWPAPDCCGAARRARLAAMNADGRVAPPVDCSLCGGSAA